MLLNGRQMPTSRLEDTAASNSRAFDFANLASEAIAAIEVYKTSRASTPTGGIGATINIKTARPLDNPGLHTSFGLKGVIDDSAAEPAGSPAGRRDHAGSLRHLQRYVRQTTSSASRSPRATRSATPASTRRRSATAGARSPATRTTGARFRNRASRARRTSPTVPMRPTPIRCRRTSATASTASSASAPTASSPCSGAPLDALTATLDYTYSENKIADPAQRAVGVVQLRSLVQQLDRRSGGGPARLHRD